MEIAYLKGWDETNKVWRKVQVDEDGKLITGMGDIFENPPTDGEEDKGPSSNWAFDHDADASAHHERYTDAEAIAAVGYNGTKYWSCPGNEFNGLSPDVNDIRKSNSGYLTIETGPVELVVGVRLPHGATITSVKVTGNAATSDSTWFMERINLAAGGFEAMAGANINTADTTVSNGVIDNSAYAYYIGTSALATNDRIYGVTITYTL